jgi:NTE family protein
VATIDLPRPVAFAMGGGAAYGAVHVGMLRALREAGVTPDLVVGTSVGSLNGALLAQRPDTAVENLARVWPSITATDVFPGGWLTRLRTLQSSKAWLSPNDGISAILRTHLGAATFADLTLPFGAVAADFATASPVTLTSGDLHTAVLASAAIPGVLPPVDVDGRSLVDGGVLPVRQAVEMGAASVIVLDCGLWGMALDQPATLIEVMLRVAAISVGRQLALDLPDIADQYPVVYLPGMFPMTTSPLDFGHHARLMTAGYTAAKPFLSVLRVDGPGLYGTPPLQLGGQHGSGPDQRGL